MTQDDTLKMYEMSFNGLISWQGHSVSNAGNNGSNRLMPRQQMLADGTVTDACSGSILKHYHDDLFTQYCEACGAPLCPACRARDARRVAALQDHPEYKDLSITRILNACAVCDAHGFMVPAKNAEEGQKTEARRQPLHKQTLIKFSYALALPGRSQETIQPATRTGASKEEGQMLMKMSVRSGEYALCIRYQSVGIGVDTEHWRLVVTDEQARKKRHQALLRSLRDSILSPEGALTATMLPHLTGISGALVVCTPVRRAPIYSALDPDFIQRLEALADESCQVYPFATTDEFFKHMNQLINHSVPALPASWQAEEEERER